jgi:hypothetical protein
VLKAAKMRKLITIICSAALCAALCVTLSWAGDAAPADASQKDPNQPALKEVEKQSEAKPDPNTPVSDPNQEIADKDDPNSEKNDALAPEEDDKTTFPVASPLPELYKACQVVFDLAVNDNGDVNYSLLRRKRSSLNAAIRLLDASHPVRIMAMDNAEKQAFWINAYNLCTLKLIVDNYPIEPKWYMILYPNNSIMQITDPWTKNYFKIQGLEYNLEEIRDEMLLQRFKDPRICFALSYAAQGGAILRKEPYRAEILDQQLDDQVRKYLALPKGLIIDKETNTVFLSNQFNIFRDTFLNSKYAEIKKFRNRKDDEKAWLNFLMEYLPEDQKKILEPGDVKFEFLRYDWLLNETAGQ